jgi:nucleotide-binding universal stress UspA family protein
MNQKAEIPTGKTNSKSFLWAIDPFEADTKPNAENLRHLLAWATSKDYRPQPVYVSAVSEKTGDAVSSKSRSLLETKAQDAIAKYLKDAGIENALPAKILFHEKASRKEAIAEVVRLAEEMNSPWIAVSSHGRSGLPRLVFGSFAEGLLRQAKCPVLFLSHENTTPEASTASRILFPTDFSPAAKSAFDQVLTHAKSLDTEVVLFYSNNIPIQFIATYEAPLMIPPGYFAQQEQDARAEAARWLIAAEAKGVPVRFVFKDEGIGPVLEKSILELAKNESVSLVSMACTSGSMEAFLTGSVARDVFRKRTFPVLVYGPKALEISSQSKSSEPTSNTKPAAFHI